MRKPIVALLLAAALCACAPVTPSSVPATPTPTPPTATPTQIPTAAPTEPPVTPAPTSNPTATTAAGAPACEVADLKASHGLVDGAAGSVVTEIVLEAAVGCSIDAFPGLGLRDGSGALITTEAGAATPGRFDLVGGGAYTSDAKLDNWCAPQPVFPVQLLLRIDGSELFVTGSSFPDEGDVPDCLANRGIGLEGTAWEQAP